MLTRLKEAYAEVKDEEKWFNEINVKILKLMAAKTQSYGKFSLQS